MAKARLIDKIHMQKRFRRSVCINSDSRNLGAALENYYCPESIKVILRSIAKSSSTGGNSAFSWTGPYGMGKSSASLLLAALACGSESDLKIAKSKWNESRSFTKTVKELRLNNKPRILIPIVGMRKNPVEAIAETLIQYTRIKKSPKALGNDPKLLIKTIEQIARPKPSNAKREGILLLADEMGKFLEHSASGNSDIYFWQLLAEAATRSEGRIILVGILHQSFGMYANSLSEETCKEWSKVQGRFADQPISISLREQIYFLSQALQYSESTHPKHIENALTFTTDQICTNAPLDEKTEIKNLLEKCLPLHPVVVLLLSTFSRTSFVQTQRSLFGFLNSHEPFGFIEFLESSTIGDYFSVEKFWDYLENNLKHIILESPNSHTWIRASDSISRASKLQSPMAERIAKIIGTFSLLPTPNITLDSKMLRHCLMGDTSLRSVQKIRDQLIKKSIIIHRKHRSDYVPYGGSDFDIEIATQKAKEQLEEISFQALTESVDLSPVTARRFSYETGASMQLAVILSPLEQIEQCLSTAVDPKMAGLAIMALTPSNRRPIHPDFSDKFSLEDGRPVVISFVQNSDIYSRLKELLALKKVYEDQALESDHIARKEVAMRISIASSHINNEVQNLLNSSKWHWKERQNLRKTPGSLSAVSSKILKSFYQDCPHIHSELINVNKLSGSASSAMRQLMREMLTKEGERRLGIDGYPAHGGLFDAVLKRTALYQEESGKFAFYAPSKKNDPTNLFMLWKKTDQYLKRKKSKVNIEEIYELWRKPPLGIKLGIMPVLLLAYLMTKKSYIAVYVDGYFKPQLEEIDIEQMTLRANRIELCYVNPTAYQSQFISKLDEIYKMEEESSILDLAKRVVSKVTDLPKWTQCTNLLPEKVRTFREIIRRAQDPIKLIYEDLPTNLNTSRKELSKMAEQLNEHIITLEKFLPDKLNTMRKDMLKRLKISDEDSKLLKSRAVLVKENTGDLRLKAFAQYLEKSSLDDDAMMRIVSLAANKPINNWSDQHYRTAQIELNMLTSLFEHTELYTNKGALPGHFILSVGTQVNGKLNRQLRDVFINEKYYDSVRDTADIIQRELDKYDDSKTKLAAIAQTAERIMREIEDDSA